MIKLLEVVHVLDALLICRVVGSFKVELDNWLFLDQLADLLVFFALSITLVELSSFVGSAQLGDQQAAEASALLVYIVRE